MLKRIKKAYPCIFCAMLTGMGTGGVIYLFQGLVHLALFLSGKAFDAARGNPVLIPAIVLGAALLGLFSSIIIKAEPDAAGGGIPSSVAAIRGIISLRWLRNLLATVSASVLTYVAGVPLGTEGPCVQLGTAVGRGTANLSEKFEGALDRYAMTSGACAGFAAVTGAPLSGILFALEEAHKKITPTLLVMSAVSVFTGVCTLDVLNLLTGGTKPLFQIPSLDTLRFTSLWLPFVIGIVCGLAAAGFTKLHKFFGGFWREKLSKFPKHFSFPIIFALCAAVGCFVDGAIGSGHSVIDELILGSIAVKLLVLVLVLRSIFFIIANNAGVTGGTFLPSLTLGAGLGMLCTVIGQNLGIVDRGLTVFGITVGMAAFIGAVNKTPLMSIAFGIEALGGGANVPSFVLATIAAYLVMEIMGGKEFAEIAIEAKEKKSPRSTHSTEAKEYVCTVNVEKDSFADGRNPDDLLLPYGCRITSKNAALHGGDKVVVCCVTGDAEYVKRKLGDVFGATVQLSPLEE